MQVRILKRRLSLVVWVGESKPYPNDAKPEPPSNYKVVFDADRRGFTLEFLNEVTETDQFVIYYTVKLTDSNLLRNNSVVLNRGRVHGSIPGGTPASFEGKGIYALPEGTASACPYLRFYPAL